MKKRTKDVILISSILVAIIAGIIVTLIISKEKEVPVVVMRWNGREEYTLCEINGEVKPSSIDFTDGTFLRTDMTMQELIDTNSEAFIGMKTFFKNQEVCEAAVFYDKNSYFYIVDDRENELSNYNYFADSLYARWSGGGYLYADIKFPFPDAIELRDEALEDSDGYEYYYYVPIFDLHDFYEMKEFYSRFSDDMYSIDEENQIITVKAYGNTNNVAWESGYNYEIVIDCKNRTIAGPGRNGSVMVLTQSPDI